MEPLTVEAAHAHPEVQARCYFISFLVTVSRHQTHRNRNSQNSTFGFWRSKGRW